MIVDLIAELQEEQGHSYHLTFDKLATCLDLVDVLTEKNINCTGPLRPNRLQDCPVKDVADMKKTDGGTFDYAAGKKSGLTVVRWNGNSIVNVVSNTVGVQPLQSAKRWSRSEKKQVIIPQPFTIHHYNQTMDSVDRTDKNIGTYQIGIRSKKLWFPIFSYYLDLTIQPLQEH